MQASRQGACGKPCNVNLGDPTVTSCKPPSRHPQAQARFGQDHPTIESRFGLAPNAAAILEVAADGDSNDIGQLRDGVSFPYPALPAASAL